MENEMIMNEEVIETATEEIAAIDSKKGLIVAGVAIAIIGGTIVYKKVIKPALAKRKAKKEDEAMDAEIEETESEDCESYDEN